MSISTEMTTRNNHIVGSLLRSCFLEYGRKAWRGLPPSTLLTKPGALCAEAGYMLEVHRAQAIAVLQ